MPRPLSNDRGVTAHGRRASRRRVRRRGTYAAPSLLSLLMQPQVLRVLIPSILLLWLALPVYLMHFSGFTEEQHPANDPYALNKKEQIEMAEPLQRSSTNLRKKKNPHFDNPLQKQWFQKKSFVDVIQQEHTRQRHSNETIDMRVLNQELAFDNPDGGVWKQGFELEPQAVSKEKPLTIYVIPHSHCDPGWIKTFDDYFQGQTKQIITSIIQALQKDKRRKFIWAEISYFEWWWVEQDEATRTVTRGLLKSGQLEFVTGGWVQPDEANTELYAMEIQLQEGHDWIRQTVGEEHIPKYAWAIDPFGYSPTMAFLLKKYGFKGMLIQRVHYAIKKELAKRKHLEFLWRQTWDGGDNVDDENSGGEYDIFTHVMPFYSYDVPHTCGPDPKVCCQFDFARMGTVQTTNDQTCPWHENPKIITQSNVAERAKLLLDQYQKKASLYRSNVVLIPLGDDFRYQSLKEADLQYNNYQTMFDYLNENVPGVSIQFGTLKDYFEKVEGTFDPPLLKGSFFTYSDREQDYWSGYFTSRVFDKALDRALERVLYAATGMGATKEDMQSPRRALSLFQHHDGITGTAKDHVANDYAKRIHDAIHFTQNWIVKRLREEHPDTTFEPCWKSDAPHGLTQNLCGDSEGTAVVLYNPLMTTQMCRDQQVLPQRAVRGTLPCEQAKALPHSQLEFDPQTGLMTHPIKEEWMVWRVNEGGAYLFFPGTLGAFPLENVNIEEGGYVVSTPNWKRRVFERRIETGETVVDFVYETNLQQNNQEWIVRFSSDIHNDGVFHTDLNGFNIDTHKFRKDMPIQSQVFPMPTLASVDDEERRMTVLSEHSQGTASLEEGSIDVWLDRRLGQDDNRGLGQGVQDNVPTRTRLRIVLEKSPHRVKKKTNVKSDLFGSEFEITMLCKRMWEQLNHPLEVFGAHGWKSAEAKESEDIVSVFSENRSKEETTNVTKGSSEPDLSFVQYFQNTIENTFGSKHKHIFPFVYMVYKRVDYFQKAMESLLKSDFNRKEIPLIVSIDGHVPEMMSYVHSLKVEFPKLIVLIHPYSCHDHPDTFPGNDESLNQNYKGDTYGSPRQSHITCAKHHFTWMINEIFLHPDLEKSDAFLFMEEDYTVARTIYETVWTGMNLVTTLAAKGEASFGICMDPTLGGTEDEIFGLFDGEGWYPRGFVSGPVAFSRSNYQKMKAHAADFCQYDDYNWDWSIVNLMNKKLLPRRILQPSITQVRHIGVDGGMHEHEGHMRKPWDSEYANEDLQEIQSFHGKRLLKKAEYNAWIKPDRPHAFGGWGHPMDQKHCMKLFGS